MVKENYNIGNSRSKTGTPPFPAPHKWVTRVNSISYIQKQGDSLRENGYRFGFNGMEKDDEVKGVGNSLDFGARIYDSRIGRFLSIDPLASEFRGYSNYSFSINNPIQYIDKDGLYPIVPEVTGVKTLIQVLSSANVKDLASFTAYYGGSSNLSVDGKNTGNKRYLYSKSNGWIDLRHVSNAALATDKWYITGAQVLREGEDTEQAQEKYDPSSAWSYEDLVSNKLGVEFESYLEDNKGEFLVVLQKFLYDKGFVDNPMEVAPNHNEIPYSYPMDSNTLPPATNKTYVPLYTIPETSDKKQSEKTDENVKNNNATK
ncbi:MAG: hypothetical protein IPN36_17905 [Bacteroidetes bacterium]|nr:hypothetical protein [Bacteroidota bacterium]